MRTAFKQMMCRLAILAALTMVCNTISAQSSWTGASSTSDLKQKLNGTTWYINRGGLHTKIVFSSGSLTMYTSRNSDFRGQSSHYYNSYEVKTKGQYLFAFFGFDEEHMADRDFGIAFVGSKAVLTQFGDPIGTLTYKGKKR